MKQDLRTLRNNAAFLFFMLNFLWLFIIFLLQVVQDQLKVGKLDVSWQCKIAIIWYETWAIFLFL